MTTSLGEMDEDGISGLEADELNLENFILEKEEEVKSSYEKTYLKLIAELSDYMQNSEKEVTQEIVSRLNN